MASLKISSNSVSNPLTLDLSQYLDVQRDAGMDPLNPQFTQKIWGRSILKEGATLALEQLTEKELLFPLYLGPIGGLASAPVNTSSLKTLEQQINQIINTPGFTVSWQPSGASQPTVFDGLSGQLDIDYDFRREQQFWEHAKLRIFTQPLGRTAAVRPYAAASGVGPLVMVTPYASGGGQVIAASTQAGVAGFGGGNAGGIPSSGIFYWGAPSLAGDAPALLQVSYMAPSPPNTSSPIANSAVALLPDQNYNPLTTTWSMTTSQIVLAGTGGSAQTNQRVSTAVASQYTRCSGSAVLITYNPLLTTLAGSPPPVTYAGQHRQFAIARGVGGAGTIQVTGGNALTASGVPVTVQAGDWQLVDIGTFGLRASQTPSAKLGMYVGASPGVVVDVTGVIILPDANTWFFNPAQGAYQQFGVPNNAGTLQVLDDVVGDQFAGGNSITGTAPSPTGQGPLYRISQYTRGLVPRPDPKNGLPILAVVGVGTGGSNNPLNLQQTVQVYAQERARYTLS